MEAFIVSFRTPKREAAFSVYYEMHHCTVPI